MINFKELFQQKNENKILNMFKNKFGNLSQDELKKFINYKDVKGNTLLHHAYNNNCHKLAQFLYDNNIGNNGITHSGNIITSISNSESEFSNNESYNNIIQSNSSNENTIYSENQIGGRVNNTNSDKITSKSSVKNVIKYTKHKKDVYIEKGKQLIEYIQNIRNDSLNIH